MKELSIEEKAKAYDEAIEKAKEMIKAMTNIGGVAKVDDIQYLFPELKESENERIRKCISDVVKEYDWSHIFGVTKDDCLAWLEKKVKGNEREIPISKPPLTIKYAKEVMGIKQDDAWSEKDELMLMSIIQTLKLTNGAAQMKIDWLKSFKDRYTWKPSDEQMEGIECTIKTLKYQLNCGDNRLDSLYNDLKKLREE